MKLIKLSAIAITMLFSTTLSAQTADEVKAKFNEAATALKAKQMPEAIALFEKTIEMASSSTDDVVTVLEDAKKYLASSYLNVGANSARTGKLDEALVSLIKADELGDAKASNMISAIYTMKGSELIKAEKFKEAAEVFNVAITRNNKDTKNAILAAQCYSKAGETDKSSAIYTSIIELGKTHSKYEAAAKEAKDSYAMDILKDATKAENFESVKASVAKVMEMDSTNAYASLILVQTANNFKKFDEVIGAAEDAVKLQTDADAKSTIYFLLGVAYQTKENKEKAIAAYKQVLTGSYVEQAKQMVADLSK